jgi:hypothetical protein
MEFCEFVFFDKHNFKQLNFHNYRLFRGWYDNEAIVLYTRSPCELVDIELVNTDHCSIRRHQQRH